MLGRALRVTGLAADANDTTRLCARPRATSTTSVPSRPRATALVARAVGMERRGLNPVRLRCVGRQPQPRWPRGKRINLLTADRQPRLHRSGIHPNRYAYAHGDPLKYTDPTAYFSVDDAVDMLPGLMLGAVTIAACAAGPAACGGVRALSMAATTTISVVRSGESATPALFKAASASALALPSAARRSCPRSRRRRLWWSGARRHALGRC